MIEITSLKQAYDILNKFEYSLDGFPKRYPNDTDFYAALDFLETYIENSKVA